MIPRGKIKDKRKAILESTLELIAIQGFHGTSIKQIAENADVAAGTIYVYFDSKKDLLESLYIEIRKELNEIIYEGFDTAKDFKANFMILWKTVLDFYLDNPLKYIFIEQFTSSPYINDIDASEVTHILFPAHSLFERAREKGVIKNMPVSALIALTHGPIISLVKMHNMKELDLRSSINYREFSEASWMSISNSLL